MDTLTNIIGGVALLAVIGFIAFKLLKKKAPKVADKIEDTVEDVVDDIKEKIKK